MTLSRDEALRHIHEHPETYLQRARVEGYICPICGSGSGGKGTGIVPGTKNPARFTCFAGGCFKGADIPDIIAIKDGLQPGSAAALQRAYDIYGITLENQPRATAYEDFSPPAQPPAEAPKPAPAADQPAQDYSAYYAAAHDRIGQTDYPQRRGLSQAIIDRFQLGYDPAWISPAALKAGHHPPPSPRLIIRTGPHSYIARDTRGDLTADQSKYRKMKEGPALAFNLQALDNAAGPIFLTEGEIDALSVIQAGGEAIGLGGTSGVNQLLKALEEKKQAQLFFILSMDKDAPGQEAEKKLRAGLDKLGIPYLQANIAGAFKDPNEALTGDPAGFNAAVQEAIEESTRPIDPRPDCVSRYLTDHFLDDIARFMKYKDRKTGFYNLDAHITGLYPGLYLVGAIPSLGKTTFIHQIGDQLAAAGDHVLYFSLEQSRLEMVTKSLSRITAQQDITKAVSAIKIRCGNITPAVLEAQKAYKSQAERVNIISLNFQANINDIQEYILRYMKTNDTKPIIVIDYLQIIPPTETRQSDKEKTDIHATLLKKLQMDNDLVVFVISSFNRNNYLAPVDFESFKESGGLEYTADCIWGLQLQALNEELFNSDKKIKEKREKIKAAKGAIPRKVELACLKNRSGFPTFSCGFDYNPIYDLFVPDPFYDATGGPVQGVKRL